ncbi:outer membrane lipoprotein-sorting protein [Pseudoalteromonas sp. OOF1S-7]|uniref:outer membrane lipoprotein-sorting protein n=1 Tax=Pseudoalteromonas sp. OOF1S-7 TaxID=2917757 RepID=UPI001EF57918|nr:outer membrane lipoprotein-sorting protein [Pseudoalteromonas sp. OOF1S-7]MCG7536677.1 outer membrane lipoprotein-sorting protein [Pseudoalteromonas sp. OOF1S-7]
MKWTIQLGIAVALVAFKGYASIDLSALSASEAGMKISQERKLKDKGWGSSEAEVEMIIVSATGEKNERRMKMRALEVIGDGDKLLTLFETPRDVKGTRFLSYSHISKPDQQWLYLPSIKRVKRIASANKSGPFMGSHFAYEDLSSFEIEKFDFKFLKKEPLEGVEHFVVEQTPKDKYSGYQRQVVWLNTKTFQASKKEYFDKAGNLVKRLTLSDYKLYKDKFWRPHSLRMEQLQTKETTLLKTHAMSFGHSFSEQDFSQASFKRMR